MTEVSYIALDVEDPMHLAAAYDVAHACEVANDGTSDTTLESITVQVTGTVAWREAQVLVMDAGKPAGLLCAERDEAGREVFLDVYAVGPRRAEVMTALMSRGVDQARRLAASDAHAALPPGADPLEMDAAFWQATAATYTTDTDYVAVIEQHGFVPVRRFWRMILPLAGWPPEAPPSPTGVRLRVVDGEADQQTLFRLRNESFSEHFGETYELDFEEFETRLRETPGCDPSRWWIAELDGEPVALCILDDSKLEFGEGHVRALGVIRKARGRGIARWLLQMAAADTVTRGLTGLALSVDGANTTGATQLYESVGFQTRQQIDLFCLPLLDSAQSR